VVGKLGRFVSNVTPRPFSRQLPPPRGTHWTL